MTTGNEIFDVIIVGCGPAGIGAAIKLKELQPTARYLILEARDRIGGRAFTDRNTFGANFPVDIGARWLCHHQPDNLLRRYYIPSDRDWVDSKIYDESKMVIFDEDGTLIPDDKIKEAIMILEQMLEKIKQYPSNSADISLLDVIHDKYKQIENERLQRVVSTLFSYLEHHEGSNLDELSAKSYFKGDGGLEDMYLTIADGLGSFIKRIAEQHNLSVELNTIVTNIDISDRFDRPVCVSAQDGRHFICKHVLVTVPLGCLKAHSITFTPPLPNWKLTAIDKMSLGLFNKVYLQFSSVFWDPKLERISVMSEHFKFYFCLPDARILVLHVFGRTARELEKQSDKEIIAQVIASLRRVYPQMTDPIKSVISRWGTDPFSRGSYSSFHVGTDVNLLEDLARESHDGRVHWAGEHTNYGGSIGYVDSGFESGQREAINIQKQNLDNAQTMAGHPDAVRSNCFIEKKFQFNI